MPTHFRVALLALFALVLAGLAWRGSTDGDARDPEQRPNAPQSAVTAESSDIAHPAAGIETADVVADEPALPPDLADLLLRAESGDDRAACLLGTRLTVCRYSGWFNDDNLEAMRQGEREAESKGDYEAANNTAAMLLSGTLARKTCSGLTPGLRRRTFELMRQAALGGEPEAIVRYATGQSLVDDGMMPYAFLRLPRFDTWRSEAPALLEALEQSGDPQAVLALLEASQEGNTFTMLMPPDPVRDAAYALLARRLFGEHPALGKFRVAKTLTPAQRREAEALARAWHEGRFGNQAFRLEDHTSGLYQPLAVHLEDSWPEPADTVPSCLDAGGGGQR